MNNTLTLKHQPVGELSNIIVSFIQFKRSLGYIYKNEEGCSTTIIIPGQRQL